MLYLFRHGRAEAQATSDAARALTDEGRAQVQDVVARFQASELPLQRILCSPYLRAQQTAELLADAFAGVQVETFALLSPETSPRQLLQALAELDGTAIALVGHNPLLSNLLSLMVAGHTQPELDLGTANLAVVSGETVAAGCAELQTLLQPREPG